MKHGHRDIRGAIRGMDISKAHFIFAGLQFRQKGKALFAFPNIVIVQVAVKPCANYWSERAGEMDTMFGKLAFLASFRDRATGTYHDAAASKDYGPAELSQTLSGMHASVFREWLSMHLEQQGRDLAAYLSTPEGRAAFLSFDRRELSDILTPAEIKPEERQLFNNDLTTVLLSLSQRQHAEPAAPVQMERIA